MYQTIKTYLHCILIVCALSPLVANAQTNEHGEFDKAVRISKNKGTVYELLKDISEQSGYLFIYDSKIINNNKKVKVKKGEYTLRDAIQLITENNRLQFELAGEYLLFKLAGEQKQITAKDCIPAQHDMHFTIGGYLRDNENKEAIAFASVGIINTSIGTITNQNGEFQLVIPDSLRNHKVRFSHIGYESREIDLTLIKNEIIDLELTPLIISLKEIVVSAVKPESLLNDMLNNLAANYASEPVYLTTFYREGIDHDNWNIDITESVLQVYKTGHQKSAANDQVKLIKKRRIISRLKTDTIFPKMRSGINSCMVLDIIKELPEFINPIDDSQYNYSYEGSSMIDNRKVNIISFKQKKYIKEPLYTGHIYIEDENKALAEVRFEIAPELAGKATHSFIVKKAIGLKIDLQKAKYIVSYKLSGDGLYYINHIRGDIQFKIRRRKHLFSSPLHFWFEMVTCDMEKDDVKTFPRNEQLSTTHIFSETEHEYDKNFWKNFNVILPEDELKEEIIRNLNDTIIKR